MELTGEKVIRAPRAKVFEALHDPAVLRQIIPGIQTIDRNGSDGRFALTVAGGVDSTMTYFNGALEVYNADPPAGLSVKAVFDSGPMGTLQSNVHLALAAVDEEKTNLAYHLTASPSGRLSAIPEDRLEERTRKQVTEFLSRLQMVLDGGTVPGLNKAEASVGEEVRERVLETVGADDERTVETVVSKAAAAPDLSYRSDRYEAPRQAPSSRTPTGVSAAVASGASYADAAVAELDTPEDVMIMRETIEPIGGAPPALRRIGNRRDDVIVREPKREGTGAGLVKWLLVAVGVLMIALMLNDMFS